MNSVLRDSGAHLKYIDRRAYRVRYGWFFARLAILMIFFCGLSTGLLAGPQAETLVVFDTRAKQNPESIVFDRHGNGYVSMAFSGEILKVKADLSQSVIARMPLGEKCGEREPVVLGIAMDPQDLLYVAVTSCDPTNHGIWQLNPVTGVKRLAVSMPHDSVINGIDIHNGYIFAADTFKGLIWRASVEGGEATIWLDHRLLKRPAGCNPRYPGPNGLRFFERQWVPEIYVAVSATGNIVAIPIKPDGSAGEPRVHVTLPKGLGGDEFTFDAAGRMYVTTDPGNVVLRVNLDGTCDELLTVSDGLDGPTSIVFGRTPGDYGRLYITNGAFPFFSKKPRPSLMRLPVDTPGPAGAMR